ncbi:MAG: PAC2 family protein [Candidatus Helarchaeota archaeon]
MNDILDDDTKGSFFIKIQLTKDLEIGETKIKTIEELKENIVNPICIQGMPGMADIGKMAADQLVVLLNAVKIMDIIFDDFPAGAIISDSILYSPRAEIYYYQDPNKKNDVLILTADAQPMSPRGIHAFSRFLSKLINYLNSNLVISLGAFPVEHPSKNNCIYVSGTSEKVLNNINYSNTLIKLSKGVIIGSNGLVPTICKSTYDIEGLIFLAETNGFEAMKKDTYDVKASIKLLDLLSEIFNIQFEDQKFNKEIHIESLEAKIKDEKESIKKELDSSKKKPMTLPYFG